MRRPDDSSLTIDQYHKVRKEAERLLRQSGALGVFPTPIHDVMSAAKVKEAPEGLLDETFIARMRRKAGDALKRALSKVLGLFDAHEGLVFLADGIHAVRKTFIRLHETGHAFMAWQRKAYSIVEDCEKRLAPEIADQFDREANVFASEVLYQLDTFGDEANDLAFNIWTPVRLSRKYGGSIYATVRRYVAGNPRACIVLVLDPPQITAEIGFRANLRRVASPRFSQLFGDLKWPEHFTPDDAIGAIIPIGKRKASRQQEIVLRDRNGKEHAFVGEAFTQTHHVFVLLHFTETLTRHSIILPGIVNEKGRRTATGGR